MDAANYAAFVFVFLMLILFSVLRLLPKYYYQRNMIVNPGYPEGLMLSVGLFITVIALYRDEPTISPKSLTELSFDKYGLFYIRQCILFYVAWLSALILLVTIIKLFEKTLGIRDQGS